MPRGQHPNSLANLKKGHKFSSSDGSATINAKKSSQGKKLIADEMRALLDVTGENGESRRKRLAAKLIMNMEKSPEWYKLGLKMIGEMPAEQIEISTPKTVMAGDLYEALKNRERELSEK